MSAHLVKGDDPVLRAATLEALLGELVGAGERALAVEDLTVPSRASSGDADHEARQAVVAAAVNAARCPPFGSTVRVVVLRDVGHLAAGDVGPLVSYLADPLATTELVLVTGGGAIPVALAKALEAAKAVEHGKVVADGADVLDAALADARIVVRPDARRAILERVGTEVGRIPAIVDVLAAAYGPDDRLTAADVEPYLGHAGSVAPWRLSQAIEAGDVAGALEVLDRLLHAAGPRQPKPMHPLQVLAFLHNQLRRVARVDDPAVRTHQEARAVLGGQGRGAEVQAKTALALARRLGTEGIREAYAALCRADLDLKGARAVPGDVVMELLVARLATLTARSGAGSRDRARPKG